MTAALGQGSRRTPGNICSGGPEGPSSRVALFFERTGATRPFCFMGEDPARH